MGIVTATKTKEQLDLGTMISATDCAIVLAVFFQVKAVNDFNNHKFSNH